MFTPEKRDYFEAAQIMGNTDLKLRGGDALHLAIVARRPELILVSGDRVLMNAAQQLGIPARFPG